MKKFFLGVILLFLVTVFGMASELPSSLTKRTCVEKKEAADMALHSMVLVQTIVKGYLYLGNENGTTELDKKMKTSLKQLDTLVMKFGNLQSNNIDIQMCLNILPVGVAELKAMIKEKSSMGNEQLIVDLATVIAQAVIGISEGVENDMVAYKKDSNSLSPLLSSL